MCGSSWTCVVPPLGMHFPPLKPLYFKLGSVLMSPGFVDPQLPCLSLMSLQTKICSRSQFDRKEKFIPAFTGPWNIVCFRCKYFMSCLFFCLTCGNCYSSSCLTSEDCFSDQTVDSWKVGHVWNKQPCVQPFLLLIRKCVFGPSSRSNQKQWVLCGWEAQAP